MSPLGFSVNRGPLVLSDTASPVNKSSSLVRKESTPLVGKCNLTVCEETMGLLSWHPKSDEFIVEYRRQRISGDVMKALILTGATLYKQHRKERLLE